MEPTGEKHPRFRIVSMHPHRTEKKARAEIRRLDPDGRRGLRPLKHVRIPKEGHGGRTLQPGARRA